MKIASLLSMMLVAVCLVGCENAELITCQQEKGLLQGQLDQAQATITERDKQIEALKTENTEIQTKAMESITTMMTKQAEADKKLKEKLAESQKQAGDLKAQNRIQQARIEDLESELKNLNVQYKKTKEALDAAQKATDTTTEDPM